jgi:hypothetical protein
MWRGRYCTPNGGAKSKYLGRGHFFPFLEKAHHQGDERK